MNFQALYRVGEQMSFRGGGRITVPTFDSSKNDEIGSFIDSNLARYYGLVNHGSNIQLALGMYTLGGNAGHG